MFETFKVQNIIALGDMEKKLREFDEVSLDRDGKARQYTDMKERNLLLKLDEFNFKMEKL